MKKDKILLFLLSVFALFLFSACKGGNYGSKQNLRTENEVINEKSKNKYSLIVSNEERVRLITPVDDLTKLDYDKELLFEVVEDERKVLSSLKINGEEKKDIVDDKKQFKLTIKNHTAIVASFADKKYDITVKKEFNNNITFLSSQKLAIGEECKFQLKNITKRYIYNVLVSDTTISKIDDITYKFIVSKNHEISIKKDINYRKFTIEHKKQYLGSAYDLNKYMNFLKYSIVKDKDIKFESPDVKLFTSNTVYYDDNNHMGLKSDITGEKMQYINTISELPNNVYKFNYIYKNIENLFKDERFENRLEIVNKADKFIIRLYNEDRTKYEDYEIVTKFVYIGLDGKINYDELEKKDGFYQIDTRNKKKASLEISLKRVE